MYNELIDVAKRPMNPSSRSFLLCARLRRDKTGAAGKKRLFLVMAVLVAFAIGYGQTKKRSAIQWKPSDCTSPPDVTGRSLRSLAVRQGTVPDRRQNVRRSFQLHLFYLSARRCAQSRDCRRSDRIVVCDQGHKRYLAQLQDYRRRSSRHSQRGGHAEHSAA